MKKKTISIIPIIAIVISSLALSAFNAFAKTQPLILNAKITGIIDGVDDMAWFIYTPDESGVYSFLSYNIPASEAYLFIKEIDPDTGVKKYTQLAYSNSDADYTENGHNSRQFCLTYHLEKGVTYYFTAGWYLSDSRVDGNTNVMLRCDSYDNEIESISAVCNAELEAFTDGYWKTDSNNQKYFYYDTSKLISNMVVTIHYSDGRESTVIGADEIDGYQIKYTHNQITNHWYPYNDPNYTKNILTVGILNTSADVDINIIYGGIYTVTGIVSDTIGKPVENAGITKDGALIATTDSEGKFSFLASSGSGIYKINALNSIERTVEIITSANSDKNNFTKTPIVLCTYDYIGDNVINAKDFAIMKKNMPNDELSSRTDDFAKHINFTKQNYSDLTLK